MFLYHLTHIDCTQVISIIHYVLHCWRKLAGPLFNWVNIYAKTVFCTFGLIDFSSKIFLHCDIEEALFCQFLSKKTNYEDHYVMYKSNERGKHPEGGGGNVL